MERSKNSNNSRRSNVLYRTVGIIFILTMLSVWLLNGLLAKYVVSSDASDSARVAKSGYIELWEHKADLKNGKYVLDKSKKIGANTYDTVIPGVDIPKDPFVELHLEESEVDYELYIKVTEKDFPTYKPTPESDPVKTVTYSVIDEYWELQENQSNPEKGIYVYKYCKDDNYVFDAKTPYTEIKILEDDELTVSEHYYGKDENGKKLTFSLSFEAWLIQAD